MVRDHSDSKPYALTPAVVLTPTYVDVHDTVVASAVAVVVLISVAGSARTGRNQENCCLNLAYKRTWCKFTAYAKT